MGREVGLDVRIYWFGVTRALGDWFEWRRLRCGRPRLLVRVEWRVFGATGKKPRQLSDWNIVQRHSVVFDVAKPHGFFISICVVYLVDIRGCSPWHELCHPIVVFILACVGVRE